MEREQSLDHEVANLTREQAEALGEQIAMHGAHLDAATHRLLADLRTFDRARGWARQGAMSCAHWLSWRLGWSGNRAREHVRVAGRLGELPRIDEALRLGEVSYCKVRAMTRVATPANEELLLEDARHCTGNQLEKICQRYAMVRRGAGKTAEEDAARRHVTRVDLADGMVAIRMTMHPDEALVIWEALSKVARERTDVDGRFTRVDAMVEICEGVVRGTQPERSPAEIVVTIPADGLAAAREDAVGVAGDGTCVSAETSRQLACDASVRYVVHAGDGSALSVGRKTRVIGTALRRALVERDSTCRFPGCTNRQYVHGHHIEHWARGGETRLDNLVLLCSFHHRFVHEYGYRVELDDQHRARFFDPRGRLVEVVPRLVRVSTPMLEQARASFAISATTNEPCWDGEPVDYGLVIDGLVRADRLH